MAESEAHTPMANDITRAIEGTTKWKSPTLTYWFAVAGDAAAAQTVIDGDPDASNFNPIDTEPHRQAVLDAFKAFELVSGLTFTEAADYASADIRIIGVDDYDGVNGSMEFPSGSMKSHFLFNVGTGANGAPNLHLAAETGGANAVARVAKHELGHGLGLGHPHDDGNGSTFNTTAAATGAGEDTLDNERYTTMSYERGGLDVKFEDAFGHAFTLSAIDIAVIQNMYGKNMGTHSGNTIYTMTDRNTTAADLNGADGSISIGRGFYTIWDTGGTDEIRYGGSKSVYINLNAASLSKTDTAAIKAMIADVKKAKGYSDLPNEIKQDIENADYHAGGFISRVFEGADTNKLDLGGYGIANGVVIENATGSDKADILIGNAASNTLKGGGGDDYVHGGAGDDTIDGGAGDDELMGGSGNDTIDGGAGTDVAIYSGVCAEYDLVKDDETGVVTVTHARGSQADGVDTLTNVEKVRFKDGEKDITGDVEDLDCPPTDFIFLVDLSGSFADDLPNFVASARDIANTMLERDPDTRFALASFVDLPVFPYGSPGDYLYKAELPLTDSIEAFEAALAGLTIFDGGDFPEAQWVGLWRAANGVGLNLRDDSSKIILLATDAPAHSAASYGLNEGTILDFLNNEGISVGSPDMVGEAGSGPGSGEADDIGEVRGPEDGENGIDPGLPTGGLELLQSLLANQMLALGATPIFALTPGGSGYEVLTEATGGAIAPLDFSGTAISDAVREALAKIDGVDTGGGTSGDDFLIGTPDPDTIFGGLGNDRIEGREENDYLDGGGGDDILLGEEGDDQLFGGSGADILIGGAGNDTLNGGIGVPPNAFDPNDVGRHDFMLGGVGNDTYHVDSIWDIVDEGLLFPEFAGLPSDFDTIISTAPVYWDMHSVGERLVISETTAGIDVTAMIGGLLGSEILGNSGHNIIFAIGGSNTVRAGDGVDFIALSTFGFEETIPDIDKPNTVIVDKRSSVDPSWNIVYEFESGKDSFRFEGFDYASGAEIFALGTNDGAGNAYFQLGDGLDILFIVGRELGDLSATDFVV